MSENDILNKSPYVTNKMSTFIYNFMVKYPSNLMHIVFQYLSELLCPDFTPNLSISLST